MILDVWLLFEQNSKLRGGDRGGIGAGPGRGRTGGGAGPGYSSSPDSSAASSSGAAWSGTPGVGARLTSKLGSSSSGRRWSGTSGVGSRDTSIRLRSGVKSRGGMGVRVAAASTGQFGGPREHRVEHRLGQLAGER